MSILSRRAAVTATLLAIPLVLGLNQGPVLAAQRTVFGEMWSQDG